MNQECGIEKQRAQKNRKNEQKKITNNIISEKQKHNKNVKPYRLIIENRYALLPTTANISDNEKRLRYAVHIHNTTGLVPTRSVSQKMKNFLNDESYIKDYQRFRESHFPESDLSNISKPVPLTVPVPLTNTSKNILSLFWAERKLTDYELLELRVSGPGLPGLSDTQRVIVYSSPIKQPKYNRSDRRKKSRSCGYKKKSRRCDRRNKYKRRGCNNK